MRNTETSTENSDIKNENDFLWRCLRHGVIKESETKSISMKPKKNNRKNEEKKIVFCRKPFKSFLKIKKKIPQTALKFCSNNQFIGVKLKLLGLF